MWKSTAASPSDRPGGRGRTLTWALAAWQRAGWPSGRARRRPVRLQPQAVDQRSRRLHPIRRLRRDPAARLALLHQALAPRKGRAGLRAGGRGHPRRGRHADIAAPRRRGDLPGRRAHWPFAGEPGARAGALPHRWHPRGDRHHHLSRHRLDLPLRSFAAGRHLDRPRRPPRFLPTTEVGRSSTSTRFSRSSLQAAPGRSRQRRGGVVYCIRNEREWNADPQLASVRSYARAPERPYAEEKGARSSPYGDNRIDMLVFGMPISRKSPAESPQRTLP